MQAPFDPIVMEAAIRAVRARRRIMGIANETPLLLSRVIGLEHGSTLMFKAENFQVTGSFKFRGALSKMTSIGDARDVITASSGNHGIASAKAAAILGRKLTVVLPKTTTEQKLERVRFYGVEVLLHGEETNEAEERARQEADSRGLVYISPYNDEEIVAGQGTVGLELLEQVSTIDNVFVSMGGGGLIGGIASVLKCFRPKARVIGVAAENSAALAAALAAGTVVDVPHFPTLADGISGGIDQDTITLPLAKVAVDEVVTCSEADIRAATRDIALKEGMIVEGAAGLALAGFLKLAERCKGQVNVVVLCGGNVDAHKILKLVEDG